MKIAKSLTKPEAIWRKSYLKMCVELTLKSSVHSGSEGGNCHWGGFWFHYVLRHQMRTHYPISVSNSQSSDGSMSWSVLAVAKF